MLRASPTRIRPAGMGRKGGDELRVERSGFGLESVLSCRRRERRTDFFADHLVHRATQPIALPVCLRPGDIRIDQNRAAYYAP